MKTIALMVLGFLTGMKHALDTDHIAAVTALVTRHKKLSSAIWAGGWWGVGHTFTLMLIGFFILLFGLSIPEKVAIGLEAIVGLMLIVLGSINLKVGYLEKFHLHKHQHDSHEHIHLHGHEEGNKPHDHEHSHSHNLKALVVGSVHGIAGSAALMLVVVATIKSTLMGLFYIAVFGVGSIMGMAIFSLIIGLPISIANNKLSGISRYITMGSGLFSVIIGFLFIFDVVKILY